VPLTVETKGLLLVRWRDPKNRDRRHWQSGLIILKVKLRVTVWIRRRLQRMEGLPQEMAVRPRDARASCDKVSAHWSADVSQCRAWSCPRPGAQAG
jgi:hypothetical protein